MVNKYFLLILIGLLGLQLSAQEKEAKIKFLFGFDSRRSFIEKKNSRVDGFRLGLQLKDPNKRIGIGIYAMRDEIIRRDESVKEFEENLDSLQLDYGYFTLFYEHVWIHQKKYEISTPFQFGLGGVERKFWDDQNSLKALPNTNVVIFEASVATHYKFLSWIGLGAGFGYNLVLSGEPEVSRAFNSPFYVLKIKLFLGEAYRGIKEKLRKKD